MKIKFFKYQALGNDFILIDCLLSLTPFEDLIPYFSAFCNRRLGIGADGVLAMLPSQRATAFMRIFNADGSEAEMCGNGIRCVAIYLYKNGYTKGKSKFLIETLSGLKEVVIIKDSLVKVKMGKPSFYPGEVDIKLKGRVIKGFGVSLGNTHCIIEEPLSPQEAGPLIENDPIFPNRTNVEFVNIKDPHTLELVVWERGVGITPACGTGACASVAWGVTSGKVFSPVSVHLPGGVLKITWSNYDQEMVMEGEAKEVFEGEISI